MTGILKHYQRFLPKFDIEPVTLGEGNTPLLFAESLSDRVGANVYLKYEGMNPTGSFKDRGMTVAITQAKDQGAQAVICASTGNTSASAAAYAARADLPCVVVIPEGKIAYGKLSQALIAGATVIQVRGSFDEALCIVREISEDGSYAVVNSINPYRIEGQKTGAFEVADEITPDFHCMPVGNAGNITAYGKGYREYFSAGKLASLPRMIGVQAQGADPILQGHPVEHPQTVASAIMIGNPASWKQATETVEQSNGLFTSVNDEEILAAYRLLAQAEGVFCEPASATGVAALVRDGKSWGVRGKTVVCVLTGHGLKDPDCAVAQIEKPAVVEASRAAITEYLSSLH